MIHLLKEVKAEGGWRTGLTKCGALLERVRMTEYLGPVSGWDRDVTCSECKGVPNGEIQSFVSD